MTSAQRSRAQPMRLPALQHASLRVMGIQLPWILAEVTQQAEQKEVMPSEVAQRPLHSETPPSAVRHGTQAQSEGSASVAAAPTVQVPSDVQELVEAARQAAKTVGRSRRAGSEVREPVTQMAAQPIQLSRVVVPAELAQMDLATLSQHISQCTACSLTQARHQVVVGEGQASARLLIVSEAPGEQEDLQGQPFVGPVGELFDNMLASIGCNRQNDVYITNVIKCRPVGNRNPRMDEIASCLPFLKRQIELVKPDVILAMGRLAAVTLVDSAVPQNTVHQLRKPNQTTTIGDRSIPVVVTYHPSYLMRRAQDKRLAWEDLKRLATFL
ncbi:uracil-DNA glycosylase [Orrella sp. 11846]|uniref:uracil-DNA glycosylase n=1 Tax=Orrella sp. 11846 TaxID=3409913 RepID=UPI003B5C71F1